jgi:hypothetical protein
MVILPNAIFNIIMSYMSSPIAGLLNTFIIKVKFAFIRDYYGRNMFFLMYNCPNFWYDINFLSAVQWDRQRKDKNYVFKGKCRFPVEIDFLIKNEHKNKKYIQ